MENCRMFEPFKASKRGKVDLLVLGECITTMRNGLNAETGAEEIGPCVKYLGELAKRNNLYLVTSLLSDQEALYTLQSYLVPMEKCRKIS